MREKPSRSLLLDSLTEGNISALTSHCGGNMAECAAVCLNDRNHSSPVELRVVGDFDCAYDLHWPKVTEQMQCCHADLQESTEHGAYGLAILLVLALTPYTAIERSRKGTGFDYWLGYPDDLPFNRKGRLEVSGILNGTIPSLSARAKRKSAQMDQTHSALPGYAVVVEFSQPMAQVVEK